MREIFAGILSPDQMLDQPQELEEYGTDWLKQFPAKPSIVLLPNSYEQVQQIVLKCNQEELHIVPSGGRTGLSGGAAAARGEVVVSLSKLNRILEVSAIDRSITCQAGVVTEKIIQTAKENELVFPVSFTSQGSSQIGGNIATNAGGINVIRYGCLRQRVINLKVVTGKGELLELNGKLIKNQTGYDLRHLFIGSEGSLGIVVEATLQLNEKPKNSITVLCGLSRLDDLPETFRDIRSQFSFVSAYEYFDHLGLSKVLEFTDLRNPFNSDFPHYLAIILEPLENAEIPELEEFFTGLLEKNRLSDVVISQNSRQSHELFKLRDSIGEVLGTHFKVHKNDISVPVLKVFDFIKELKEELKSSYPDFDVAIFGHIGDGNLHLNVIKPESLDINKFKVKVKESDHCIFALIQKFNGSISAEHGVGLLKKDYLHYSRSEAEIELMRGIKRVFDPNGIMNPGKIFDL